MRFLYALTNTFAGDNKLVLSSIEEALLGNRGVVSWSRPCLLI